MTTPPKSPLDARRDELADDISQFCICAGPTCSGCEDAAMKLFKKGWDACRSEMQAEIEHLNRMLADERSGDCDKDKTIRRLESNLSNVQAENQKLREALESIAFYSSCGACEENQAIRDKALEG